MHIEGTLNSKYTILVAIGAILSELQVDYYLILTPGEVLIAGMHLHFMLERASVSHRSSASQERPPFLGSGD